MQKKSRQEDSDMIREDLPAAGADDNISLKLDLQDLDQPVSPTTPRGAVFAVDSARTLADIPDDYLMTASARSAAEDKLTDEAGTKPESSMVQVPLSLCPSSVALQSAGGSYSQDFSSAAATTQKPTEPDMSKHSPSDDDVLEEIVETAEDVSEVLFEADVSTSAVKSVHEMSNHSASDRAASPSKSAAEASIVTTSAAVSLVVGKYCVMIEHQKIINTFTM